MISIVMAFIISIPFVVLIGAVAMPEYLLMSTVFISGMCLLGGQIGLNALAGTMYPTFVRSSGRHQQSCVDRRVRPATSRGHRSATLICA